MIARTEEDFIGLKEIGKIVATIRDELVKRTAPGITTKELDLIAKERFEQAEAISAPKGEYDFPGYTCISVNKEVAHGIPGDYVIREGDLINIDVSASKNGYFADTGISFVVGKGTDLQKKLCQVAKKAFDEGLKHVNPGSKISDIGNAVYQTAKDNGLTVIKNLTGHGIGRAIHEAPDHIYNFKNNWDDEVLKEGMVIAFEPFISSQEEEVYQEDDGWTIATEGSLVAQMEHTIILTKEGPVITTI
ncbi:methionyl aminopeptidase [Gracilibacillus ureilyticus]|uniref:Methionine aminopeptidase n=1 Tax=Gracilibacillus ureilyticus TaxID=531814 RepID=A0A1H9PJB7_9BACI|nr:type I methionyl aminopeptidase [Gracilibacillus ureilyticus]SER47653.1 methionyl aminopeptidase [Gracilibacillus ureilyticus]